MERVIEAFFGSIIESTSVKACDELHGRPKLNLASMFQEDLGEAMMIISVVIILAAVTFDDEIFFTMLGWRTEKLSDL